FNFLLSFPPPPTVLINLKFTGYREPVSLSRQLAAHINAPPEGSYLFIASRARSVSPPVICGHNISGHQAGRADTSRPKQLRRRSLCAPVTCAQKPPLGEGSDLARADYAGNLLTRQRGNAVSHTLSDLTLVPFSTSDYDGWRYFSYQIKQHEASSSFVLTSDYAAHPNRSLRFSQPGRLR